MHTNDVFASAYKMCKHCQRQNADDTVNNINKNTFKCIC